MSKPKKKCGFPSFLALNKLVKTVGNDITHAGRYHKKLVIRGGSIEEPIYIAHPPSLIDPFDRRRFCYPKLLRCGASRKATFNRHYEKLSNVGGKRSRHAGWHPSPAHILNHK